MILEIKTCIDFGDDYPPDAGTVFRNADAAITAAVTGGAVTAGTAAVIRGCTVQMGWRSRNDDEGDEE